MRPAPPIIFNAAAVVSLSSAFGPVRQTHGAAVTLATAHVLTPIRAATMALNALL